MLEHCSRSSLHRVTNELLNAALLLSRNQFGNYVIQHILAHGAPRHVHAIVRKMRGKVLEMSQHKYASNVCEKAFMCASDADRDALIAESNENNELNRLYLN